MTRRQLSRYSDLTPRQRFFWALAVATVVCGLAPVTPRTPEAPPAPKPPKTVENMCDDAAAQIEAYAPHAPGWVYTGFETCMKQREQMQHEGLTGDFDAAVKQFTRIICERAQWQGICQLDAKRRAP